MNIATSMQIIPQSVLDCISRGWPVLPIWGLRSNGVCACPSGASCKSSPGKHPLIKGGCHAGSTDLPIVHAWAEKYSGCNWAVATGRLLPDGGYLCVIDVDPRNFGDETLGAWEKERGALPHSIRAISGGKGPHYYYSARKAHQSRPIDDGIDFKCASGYVVIDPSKHHSGGVYCWDAGADPSETDLAELPEWIADYVDAVERSGIKYEAGKDDAKNSLMGEAFFRANMLGEALLEGKRMVECPWSSEHSDDRGRGKDSSTVIFPAAVGHTLGGFRCLHSHCAHRKWDDVLTALPQEAVKAARRKYKPRPVEEIIPTPISSSRIPVLDDDASYNWRDLLDYCNHPNGTKSNRLRGSERNVALIFTNDEPCKGLLAYDEFHGRVVACGELPTLDWSRGSESRGNSSIISESDYTRMRMWAEEAWGIRASRDVFYRGVTQIAARKKAYHPVRDYLNSCADIWDNIPRLDTVATRYLGAQSKTGSHDMFMRWFLIAAVARVFQPGCKVDTCLVLEGAQGMKKSTFFSILSGEWFADSPIAIGNKDAFLNIRGSWIVELAELGSYLKKDQDVIKQFLSSPVDKYRPPYATEAEDFPRQCVFCGTVNEFSYLKDATGARRFNPIRVTNVDTVSLKRDRDQIWAEAMLAWRSGARWWADTREDVELAELAQEDRFVLDAWEQPIQDYVGIRDLTYGVTVGEILLNVLHLPVREHDKDRQSRVFEILARLGFHQSRPRQADGSRPRVWMPPPKVELPPYDGLL